MPAPATVDELLELVRKSGVTDESRLEGYLRRLAEQGGVPAEPGKLAGLLVRDGLLTYFQAEQLLQGKYKRFTLGKYKVLEKLGSGGMGQVFLCEHKLMRRRVAVKVLPSAKAADEASLKRFIREAQAIAAVDHPNIVRAYDIDQEDHLHFLVMEYVDGTNLQELVKKVGPLDVTRACHYVYGAAVGLQHAHQMGLVHRDIKPGNILVDRSGVVKILDLGLARFFHDDVDQLTKKYDEHVLGTADYLSPEQAEDSHGVDIRADIYSLGATFYFLLTGSAPFPEGSIPQKLIWHRSRQPRPVKSLRPEVPDEVAAVVEKMMAKKSADRYQTPAEVMAALAPWVANPIPPPSDRELPQLSPAAIGAAGGRAPSTVIGAALRTVVAPAPGAAGSTGGGELLTPPAGSGAAGGGPPASGEAVWESLADTPTEIPAPTDRPGRSAQPVSTRVRTPPARGKGRLFPLALVAGSVLLLAGAAAGVYLAFFRDRREPADPAPAARTPRRLVVSKAGPHGEGSYGSLAEALNRAAHGDTVVLADSPLQEPALRLDDRRRWRDVTIESGLPDGKPAVVEFNPPGATGKVAAFAAVNIEGLKVRNVEFDGKGAADYGVSVSGTCPGLVLENVTVRGVKASGFQLANVAGEAGRPVTLDRVRAVLRPGSEAGLVLNASPGLETRRVVVRNGRFEGPGKAGVRVDGAATEVELTGNRLYRLDAAFSFAKMPDGKEVRVRVTENTVYEAKEGFHFDAAPAAGKLDVVAARNYFGKTQALARGAGAGGPVAGLVSQDNAADKASKPGNAPFEVTTVDAPDLPLNPDDPGFLKFPPGREPVAGPNKVRAGAN